MKHRSMPDAENTHPLLEGRRILLVVPPSRFDERQFYQSWQLLSEEGAWLVAASDSPTGIAAGETGTSVEVQPLDEVDPRSFDAVLVVEGGQDVRETLERAGRVLATMIATGRVVAAFGQLGEELRAAGLPVVDDAARISRFIAELAAAVARRPARTERTVHAAEPTARD